MAVFRTRPKLRLLQVDVTNECPLLCTHCSNNAGPGQRKEFPVLRLLTVLAEAKQLGAETLVISGGEPLRYSQLFTILSGAVELQLQTVMYTTGIRDITSRLSVQHTVWKQLKELGLTVARFSIYSSPAKREFHNRIVRVQPNKADAFAVNEEAILSAVTNGVRVELNFVPCAETIPDFLDMCRWASDLGCKAVHVLVPTRQGRNRTSTSLEVSSDAEGLLKQFVESGKASLPVFLSRFWQRRWNWITPQTCASDLEQLIVRCDGTISPCNACKYADCERESVLDQSLISLWKESRMLNTLRAQSADPQLPFWCKGVLATDAKESADPSGTRLQLVPTNALFATSAE
jgi:MoaA/NifB/PqqE/SkfB family radical SAM enzyme